MVKIHRMRKKESLGSLERGTETMDFALFIHYHPIRICSVLVSTDVAGMGLDVEDLNVCINIGI